MILSSNENDSEAHNEKPKSKSFFLLTMFFPCLLINFSLTWISYDVSPVFLHNVQGKKKE